MEIEQFADSVIENCQKLAEMRCQNCPLPEDKYSQLCNFAQILVFNCYSKVYHSRKSGEIKPEDFLLHYLSHLTLFLHIVDRVAISNLEQNFRHILMSELGEFAVILSIHTMYPDLGEEEVKDLFVECMGYLNSSVKEYGQYEKVIESEGEGAKGTLLWEFCKRMIALQGSQNNIGAILGEYGSVATMLKNLEIHTFVEAMK